MRSSSLLHQHGQRVRLHQRNDARCGGRGTSVDLFNAVLGMLAIRPFGGCRLSTICKSSAAHHRVLEPSSTTSEWNPDHGSPVRKPHRDHRRRRHRLQHCLSPDQARPARRRAAGAAAAHAWRDLARRGTRRPAAQQQQPRRGSMCYSAELYGKLEAETGQATGWHGVGSLRLASSAARWQELKRSATMAKGFGFHVELVSAQQARELFPLARTCRCGRRGLDRGRWLRRSHESDQRLRRGRTRRRRAADPGRNRHGDQET